MLWHPIRHLDNPSDTVIPNQTRLHPVMYILTYVTDTLSDTLTPCYMYWHPVRHSDTLLYILAPCQTLWHHVIYTDILSDTLTPCYIYWHPVRHPDTMLYILIPHQTPWQPVIYTDTHTAFPFQSTPEHDRYIKETECIADIISDWEV